MRTQNINRRQFLKKATTVAAGTIIFPYAVRSSALGKSGAVAASDRIVMGCIGMGSQGPGNMRAFLGFPDVQVAAVCDVRAEQRQKGKKIVDSAYGNKDCAAYCDFQEMLGRSDIDAIMSAPPDHWHAVIGIHAARSGKHMYYEKPMGLSIEQAKAVRKAVNKYNVVFQLGTQQRSEDNFRFGCELVRNKRIGDLKRIIVAAPPSITWPTLKPEPIKEDIDYDMWLGPAPYKPYNYERCRPYVTRPGKQWFHQYSLWYHISDYCLGFVANWGIHHLDIAQWGHGTDNTGPVEIEATGTFPKDGAADTATGWEAYMKYADGVELIYIHSDISKARYPQFADHGRGILFEGSEGWVVVARDGFIDANPKSLLTTPIGPDEIHLIRSTNHQRNFLDAVKNRTQNVCPIETAVRTDTLPQLTDIAMRLGRKLDWDPEREIFKNDPDANRMLKRAMRSPWHL